MPKNWSKGKSKLRILWTTEEELSILSLQRKDTIVWTLLKTLCIQSRIEVPTWAAYNSAIGKSNLLTLFSTLPVINGSPTEWDNLYTAIRIANDLSKKLLPEQKTITSFDLQLYAKAVLLQANPEIRNNFVFRMGELHAVFCFLKVLVKMIDGSGLDQSFEEARNLFDFFINSSSMYLRSLFTVWSVIYIVWNLTCGLLSKFRVLGILMFFQCFLKAIFKLTWRS